MGKNFLKRKSLPVAAGIGVAGAAILTVLFCLVGAAGIHRQTLPMSSAAACAAAAAGLAVFLAVFITARLRGRQALPLAGIVAAGCVLLAALVCALGGEKSAFGPWFGRLSIAAAAGALLGAVMSIRQNPHKKRRTQKR